MTITPSALDPKALTVTITGTTAGAAPVTSSVTDTIYRRNKLRAFEEGGGMEGSGKGSRETERRRRRPPRAGERGFVVFIVMVLILFLTVIALAAKEHRHRSGYRG